MPLPKGLPISKEERDHWRPAAADEEERGGRGPATASGFEGPGAELTFEELVVVFSCEGR